MQIFYFIFQKASFDGFFPEIFIEKLKIYSNTP